MSEISWCKLLLTFVNQKADLVFNSLCYRKPVKFISDRRCNVVILAPSQHQTGSSIEHSLEWSKMCITHTIQHTVAVVNSAGNKCMHHCLHCFIREGSAHCPYLSKMIEALACNSANMR